jgi:hypothetical protein
MDLFNAIPAMNRWAIFGRPYGTFSAPPSTLGVRTAIIN